MKDINKRIATIESLVEEDSVSSLTYAALECRITLELICYERLMISYGYTSYSDLRGWQPKQVVQQVAQEANELAATSLTLSVSKTPVDPNNPPRSADDFESFEYVELGKQVGFDVKEVGKLWNALSGSALHVQVPKSRDAQLSIYGSPEKIRANVEKALSLFKMIATGNLLMSSPGLEVTFECAGCGATIRRKKALVYNGMIASCSSANCEESYVLTKSEEGIEFGRRQLNLPCDGCGTAMKIPLRTIDRLRTDQSLTAECGECGRKVLIMLRPCKAVLREDSSC